jgi:hypothetical protein
VIPLPPDNAESANGAGGSRASAIRWIGHRSWAFVDRDEDPQFADPDGNDADIPTFDDTVDRFKSISA